MGIAAAIEAMKPQNYLYRQQDVIRDYCCPKLLPQKFVNLTYFKHEGFL
jgi:hypothetical protein